MPTDISELPNNNDAERGLIGLSLVKGYIPAGARVLSTLDFYNPRNRAVWSAFLELTEENQAIEPLGAADVIKRYSSHPISSAELLSYSTGIPNTHENVYVE